MRLIYGVSFFSKTNIKNSIVLFSWHHPKSITWRFSLWVYIDNHARFLLKRDRGGLYVRFLWLSFSWNVQDHMWRIMK